MQYSVPQFIDKEKTLLGPLTVRQTVILGSTAIFLGLVYVLFNFFIFSIALVLFGSLGVVLAFVRINDRPFHEVIVSFFNYFVQPRTYFWKKQKPKQMSQKRVRQQTQEQAYVSYTPPAQQVPGQAQNQQPTNQNAPAQNQTPPAAQPPAKQTKKEDIQQLAELLDK